MLTRKTLQFTIFFTITLFSGINEIQSKNHPFKPQRHTHSLTATQQFECGTYRGNEKENLWNYYRYQSTKKKSERLSASSFVFDDVWVAEDDGSILISGINPFDTDQHTFHFVPVGGGYDITAVPFNFDSDLGTNLLLGDDENATVNLSFTFNYFGVAWSDVHVNANGIVSFGADVNPGGFYDNNDFLSETPKIAAYFLDLNPAQQGGVFQKSESNKTTLTWNNVREFEIVNSNTLQLVLRADGSFDVTFNGIDAKIAATGTPITFGIHPGGTAHLETISFSDDLPFSSAAHTGLFENYMNITQPMVNDVALMQNFYRTFPDSFFQFIFFTNFPQTLLGFANEVTIKNSAQGIGVRISDDSGLFGSNGVLESRCNMNQLDAWPANPKQRFFRGENNFLTIMGQEAGHRWGAFVNFIDADGNKSNLILGRADAHWSYFFDSDHSSLEGGNWQPLSDNTFTTPTQIDFFSELDEYLMGLRTPEEVAPRIFVSSATNNLPDRRALGTPVRGSTATGTAVEVTIEAIIAAEGPRLPAEADVQKDLRQAFILVTQNGGAPPQSDLDKIAAFRKAWEDYFEVSVDGRFTINTSLSQTFPVAVIKGHVLDSVTKQPIQNILVKSTERGFSQFVQNGGRYTFRYLAASKLDSEENITLEVGAPDYKSATQTFNLPYGSEMVFDFELPPLATGVGPVSEAVPTEFILYQNHPNPFNPITTIRYDLAKPGRVELSVFNILGEKIRKLVSENQNAGNYAIQWNGQNEVGEIVASGLYIYQIQTEKVTISRKMLFLK